jgi:hypothetical protein
VRVLKKKIDVMKRTKRGAIKRTKVRV